MREYSKIITLSNNSRGILSLDTIIGCKSGIEKNEKGCFSECYAAKYAKRYGYNFGESVKRYFKSGKHAESISKKINKSKQPFLRIGTSGDPSEDWNHTIKSILALKDIKKDIVIITRHWNIMTDEQLDVLSSLGNVIINTSISALDGYSDLKRCLKQYKRIGSYCKSILRVITFEPALDNHVGYKLSVIQDKLLGYSNILETILRVGTDNKYVSNGYILAKKYKFLDSKVLASKREKTVYFGKCKNCKELCGASNKYEL